MKKISFTVKTVKIMPGRGTWQRKPQTQVVPDKKKNQSRNECRKSRRKNDLDFSFPK